MSFQKPDVQDAELVLKVYDMRREAVLRESRSALGGKFMPKNYDEFVAVTKYDHPFNTAWRQVNGYWDMVYSFARHGIVNPDFWVENNGEGIFLYAKFQPFLDRFKKEVNPNAFANTEWLIANSAEAKKRLERLQAMFKKMAEGK
ncbi:MAG TPA: hypothetical protein VL860_07940 [Planctomycetota bacterium]|jgi:hypothetical protein|nr:hypothetical protein [Planctomycetota bacterium]